MQSSLNQYFLKGKQREIELLLRSGRREINSESQERIRHLAECEIDWEYFLAQGFRHRLVSILYLNLKEILASVLPTDAFEELKAHVVSNTQRNLLLSVDLLKVLNAFGDRDIKAVPFKGPVLAEAIYGDCGLREFGDLDILVYEQDIASAFDLLESLEFQPEIRLRREDLNAFARSNTSLPFIKEKDGVNLDVHWELTKRYVPCPFDLPAFDDRLEPGTLAGREVPILSSEDLLLYLCVHGALHVWNTIDSIFCVGELVKCKPDMDWDRIESRAGEMQCFRMTLLGLVLAHELAGTELPHSIRKSIQVDPKISKLTGPLYKSLFNDDDLNGLPESTISSKFDFFHLKVRDSLVDRVRYAFRLMTSPSREEWRLFNLHGSLSNLHFIIRPVRLLVMLGLSLMRRLLFGGGRIEV